MDGNATDEATRHQEVEGRDDPQHARYITWTGQDRWESKERSRNLTALRLIAQQGVDEKSQLKEWKADPLSNLTSEIAQIYKAHDDVMEAQREEMERQRKQFQFEIEMLGESIRELEREKEGSAQGQTQKENRSVPR